MTSRVRSSMFFVLFHTEAIFLLYSEYNSLPLSCDVVDYESTQSKGVNLHSLCNDSERNNTTYWFRVENILDLKHTRISYQSGF